MACKRCLLSVTKIAQEIASNGHRSPPFECQLQWRRLGVGMWDNPFETKRSNKRMYEMRESCMLDKLILSHPYYWHDANGDDARRTWVTQAETKRAETK